MALVSVNSFGIQIIYPAGVIVDTCRKKYLRAVQNLQESHEYFLELTQVPTREQIANWEHEITNAERKRTTDPEAMDVMEPRVPKRKCRLPNTNIFNNTGRSAHVE